MALQGYDKARVRIFVDTTHIGDDHMRLIIATDVLNMKRMVSYLHSISAIQQEAGEKGNETSLNLGSKGGIISWLVNTSWLSFFFYKTLCTIIVEHIAQL